jgi:predicted nucleic acid-binding Zn ribbon protein
MKRTSRISDFLEECLAGQGLSSVVRMVRLRSAWPEIVGPLLSVKTSPSRLKNGVVTVIVQNHAWAQELQLKKPVLLEQANAVLGGGTVRDIRFTVGQLPAEEATEAETSPPMESPPFLPEPEGIAGVADPETRRILLSIARRIASLKR